MENYKVTDEVKQSLQKFKERLANGGNLKREPEPMSQEYKDYVKKLNEPTIRTPTKEDVIDTIWKKLNQKAVGGNFTPTTGQYAIMNDLFAHFAKNPPQKGYLITGGYGCGKTEIMKAFISTRFHPYDYLKSEKLCHVVSAIQMVEHYNVDSNFNKYFQTNLYIDDFGTEQRAKYMSKDQEPILSKFIELWYMNHRHRQLYITTNLSPDELQSKYGGRVYSRLNELCHFVELQGKDFRLEK